MQAQSQSVDSQWMNKDKASAGEQEAIKKGRGSKLVRSTGYHMESAHKMDANKKKQHTHRAVDLNARQGRRTSKIERRYQEDNYTE